MKAYPPTAESRPSTSVDAVPPAGAEPGASADEPTAYPGRRLLRRLLTRDLLWFGPELILVLGPILIFLRSAEAPLPSIRVIAVLVLALPFLGALLLWDGTRALRAMLDARAGGQAPTAEGTSQAESMFVRLAGDDARLRAIQWLLIGFMLIVPPVVRGRIDWVPALGAVTVLALHTIAACAWRATWLARELGHVRGALLPSTDVLRLFRPALRPALVRTVLVTFGLGHAGFILALYWITHIPTGELAVVEAWAAPGYLVAGIVCAASLRRRFAPIARYFDQWTNARLGRGLLRDEQSAPPAFASAQALPYRLALYGGFAFLLVMTLAVAAARKQFDWPIEIPLRILLALVVAALSACVHALVAGRRVVLPLLRHLGSRHYLPPDQTRSTIGLRGKILFCFTASGVLSAGFLALAALAVEPVGQVGMALMGICVLVPFGTRIAHDLVAPVQVLGSRSADMARGELARPVPPAGETDEIGRLTVAFEQMRRALRSRLRSTESINIDLEREVRRRTEALEQRNAELHDALAKLEKAKDDLVRSEKLASMGRLVAGIAHEINNPVNAVINSLVPLGECLDDLRTAKDPATLDAKAAEAREILSVIQRGADRTRAIVRALHNYSRGDDEVFQPVDLVRSLTDTLDLLRHRLDGVAVERALEPGLVVEGLPGQLDQVWMNLCSNALHALLEPTPGGAARGGPRLIVRAARVGDTAEIEVEDNGPGIPPEIEARIFDPFFTTKGVGEGTGLGLSIVHGIVGRHGGRIDVFSKVGQGTRFRVVLPLRRSPEIGQRPVVG